MIPNHLALIPHNVHQFAATQAIIDVERKQLRGTQLGQHPYARALFRHLRGGAMRITAKDIRFAAGDYSPKERGGASKSDYIAALDKLIETRGMDCPLPLSGSAVKQYFPDEHYRLSERKNRQWELRFARVDKIEAKQRQQKRRERPCRHLPASFLVLLANSLPAPPARPLTIDRGRRWVCPRSGSPPAV